VLSTTEQLSQDTAAGRGLLTLT